VVDTVMRVRSLVIQKQDGQNLKYC
jgi:hypothetical protein